MSRSRRHSFRTVIGGLLACVVVVAAAGCGSASSDGASTSTAAATSAAATCTPPDSTSTVPKPDQVTGDIRVLAAASLTGAFGDLAKAFERTYPHAKVATSFGASSDLVAQVHQGAPADVLATADTETMDEATKSSDVESPVAFTCNQMMILTARGNPLHIDSLADLARSDVRFVLCAAPVPCGRLGREVLTKAGVDAHPVGSEADVKAVVAKVLSGEVDAGIVYVTDARAVRGQADGIAIPASQNVTTTYPMAVTRGSEHPETARAFVDFVRSPAGQRILDSYGFGAN